MDIVLVILVILLLCGGGWGFYGGWNRGSGGIVGLLVIILIIYLLFGSRLRAAEPLTSSLRFRTPVPTLRALPGVQRTLWVPESDLARGWATA